MNSRRLWNLRQRHKFLRAEASRDILKFRVSEMTFPGGFRDRSFDDFRDPPLPRPLPHVFIFQANLSGPSLWILLKFSVIPSFGFSVTTDLPFCSPKNQVIPPKILCQPRPHPGDRSPRGIFPLRTPWKGKGVSGARETQTPATQLSTATTLLCFWLCRCRVDVLQS